MLIPLLTRLTYLQPRCIACLFSPILVHVNATLQANGGLPCPWGLAALNAHPVASVAAQLGYSKDVKAKDQEGAHATFIFRLNLALNKDHDQLDQQSLASALATRVPTGSSLTLKGWPVISS